MVNSERDFLIDILNRRCPNLVGMVDSNCIESADVDRIISVLGDELLEFGITSDFEPNDLGLRVEKLIDFFNRKKFVR